MSTTSTRNAFGPGRGEPAAPGAYGERPRGYRLPDTTRLGPVHLQVTDVERSVPWYANALGMRVVRRESGVASLAVHGDDAPLVELVEWRGARPAGGERRLGLFHFAILLPRRAALAAFVRHLGAHGVHAGAGDHVVSEAFYLNDPDGLGIEVYADRPRDTWRQLDRQLVMGTDPVDIADLMRSGDEPWTGMPAGTVMGHVHLSVGDLETSAAFFSEALGFDRIVWSYPGALFMSAGGYHHHLGTNTWAGPSARRPADGDARLLEWTIVVPSPDDVADVARSLEDAGHDVTLNADASIVVSDPWGTVVRIRA